MSRRPEARHGLVVARAVLLASAGLFGPGSGGISGQAPAVPVATGFAVVLAARLNVRAAPALDSRVHLTAERGDTLCVTRVSGDWAEVFLPSPEVDSEPIRGFAARGFLSERRGSSAMLASVGCTGLRPTDPRLVY